MKYLLLSLTFFYGLSGAKNKKKPDIPSAPAPSLNAAQRDTLGRLEDSLVKYFTLLQNTDSTLNMSLKQKYNRQTLQYLKTAITRPYSFFYPFDKLKENVAIVVPQDSAFRIMTWQYSIDDLSAIKRGLLQMNSPDGKGPIFPLIDKSSEITRILDTITTPERWIGAMYYAIYTRQNGKRKIYTLLGIDENTILSTKKWIEILRFDKNGRPYFGGNFFYFPPPAPPPIQKTEKKKKTKVSRADKKRRKFEADLQPILPPQPPADRLSSSAPPPPRIHYKRYMIEYNKFTVADLRYDSALGMLIFDHLIPAQDFSAERKHTYSINGDYSGFKWQQGRWEFIENVFDFTLEDGAAPVEKPLNFKKRNEFQKKLHP